MTLIELVVAIAVVGILAAIATQVPIASRPVKEGVRTTIDSLRRQAMRTGRSLHVTVRDTAWRGDITALPTGEIVADTALGVDELTGEVAR